MSAAEPCHLLPAAFIEFANEELFQLFLCGKGPECPGGQQMGHEPEVSPGSKDGNGSLGYMDNGRDTV